MVQPLPRGRNPFDETGVQRGADGVARYVGRPPSLVAMLRASVERDAAATALVEVGGSSLSYGELWQRAARVAGGLRGAGVARGDRVAIRLGNGIDWVLAFFGAQLLGAVVVPVNTRFTEEEVAYVVSDSGASYTFEPGAALPDGEPVAGEDLGPDDLAAIFYTSGTTGFPKGAMTSHANFLTNSENAFRCLSVDRAEGPSISTLVSVPLFHVTGCNSQLIPVLEHGGRVEILSGPLDLDGFFQAVGEHGVNQLVSVPAIYHAVVRHPRFAELDVSRVRWVSYGGAPIAESLVHRIKEAFPHARVGNGFGLTETSSLTSFLPHEEAEQHADSVGFAMPVVDLALDEADPQTGVGELLVRGPNVVQGYWNKPRGDRRDVHRRLAAHRRSRARGRRRPAVHRRPQEGHDQPRRRERVLDRGRERARRRPRRGRGGGRAGARRDDGREGRRRDRARRRRSSSTSTPSSPTAARTSPTSRFPSTSSVREDPLPRNPGGKVLKAQLREQTSWGDPLR